MFKDEVATPVLMVRDSSSGKTYPMMVCFQMEILVSFGDAECVEIREL